MSEPRRRRPGPGRSQRSATRRAAAAARERAETLGPVVEVEPAARRVDGFPELSPTQAYVFRAGAVYHSTPCEVVMARWDDNPASVVVVETATVGRRRRCGACASSSV